VGYFLPARKLFLAGRLRKPVFGGKYMGEKGGYTANNKESYHWRIRITGNALTDFRKPIYLTKWSSMNLAWVAPLTQARISNSADPLRRLPSSVGRLIGATIPEASKTLTL
jgi:hypothetical protein